MGDPAATLLDVRNVEVVYNDVILVLRGVSLQVQRGARNTQLVKRLRKRSRCQN